MRLHYANFNRRVFRPACLAAGLQGVTFHTLRRTHATMLVDAGVNPKVIQQRIGHRSIQTTLGVYASATEQGRRSGAGVMSQYMSAADAPSKLALLQAK